MGGGEEIVPKSNIISEQATVHERDCQEINPAAFDYCEDMASLTHLNEASVLYNLRARFNLDLIHVRQPKLIHNSFRSILQTFSGLFCVTINPWRWLPLYTKDIMHHYEGQQKNRPPHVYAIANNAFLNVVNGKD